MNDWPSWLWAMLLLLATWALPQVSTASTLTRGKGQVDEAPLFEQEASRELALETPKTP